MKYCIAFLYLFLYYTTSGIRPAPNPLPLVLRCASAPCQPLIRESQWTMVFSRERRVDACLHRSIYLSQPQPPIGMSTGTCRTCFLLSLSSQGILGHVTSAQGFQSPYLNSFSLRLLDGGLWRLLISSTSNGAVPWPMDDR
ncbi:hypothetical protein V8E53_008752 [Lactarius tabidus]